MFDMMKMMGKMKDFQAKLKEAQDKLEDIRAYGESGGGMVKAVANGKKQIISLDIDETLINPNEVQMLKDLIIAATNIAIEKAEELGKEEVKKSTEGMMPNIPGLDLFGQ